MGRLKKVTGFALPWRELGRAGQWAALAGSAARLTGLYTGAAVRPVALAFALITGLAVYCAAMAKHISL